MKSAVFASILTASAFAQPLAPASPGRSVGLVMAKVSVEVFSDYQCPFFREFYFKAVKPLIAEYARTNKIFFVHREFPLENLHPYAREAACYACAAGRVGKYEEVCDSLFRDQAAWSKTGKVA